MIDLEVYTREKPKLTPKLTGDLGIYHVKTIDKTDGILRRYRDYREIYRWVPWPWDVKESARPFVNIEVNSLKSRWSIYDEEAANYLLSAKQEGLVIPERFVALVRRNAGTIANTTAYRFSQNHPDLEKVTDLEPLWGILKFTRGQPSYHTSFETPIWASLEAITKMCELAITFAKKFNGIVWGEDQFGPHDPIKLYQLYNGVNEGVTGLLSQFFDISPAEKE